MEKRRFRGSRLWSGVLGATAAGLFLGPVLADGWNASRAPNQPDATYEDKNGNTATRWGGISNTRHNLTMSYLREEAQGIMGPFRNNYYEVCVYCHTPHGANATAAAPLWNRTVTQRTYTLYNNANSLAGGQMSQPGPNSLTCLSCHDGVTAIDSIINMPTQLGGAYRAGYNVNQQSGVDEFWLDNWGADGNKLFEQTDKYGDPLLVSQPNPNLSADRPSNGAGTGHYSLNGFGDNGAGPCLSCHSASPSGGAGNAPNFEAFLIGNQARAQTGGLDSDGLLALGTIGSARFLADDHPIGVQYPKEFGPEADYKEPDIKKTKIAFWDLNDNQHADPNEVRLYDTGEGYEVECGSCHDPHGVAAEVAVAGDKTETHFIPSFLRVGRSVTIASTDGTDTLTGNTGSDLCLTCHAK
ncbi:MAG: hypothetical protein OEZ43_12090 [Gammaproteobacteria bacterium]|nr:hypothetical protein [Gammaproteobacteria bacterium]